MQVAIIRPTTMSHTPPPVEQMVGLNRPTSLGFQSQQEIDNFLQLLKTQSAALPRLDGAQLPPSLANRQPMPIVEGAVYFANTPTGGAPHISDRVMYWPIEANLMYISFSLDFGPYNMAQLYRFCNTVELLRGLREHGFMTCFFSSANAQDRANAAVLMGSYMVLYGGMTAPQVMEHFERAKMGPFMPFRDAGALVSTYHLQVADVLAGMERANGLGWISLDSFDMEDYELHEQPEFGDWNWIVPNKFLAFAGPTSELPPCTLARCVMAGMRVADWPRTLPAFYIPHFKRMGVGAVVRLNEPAYDASEFVRAGITHLDLIYPDGHNPSMQILAKFLCFAAQFKEGAIAVHCKAGLGRTGTLICAYMMGHYGFSAAEAIGYSRVCRPGMVVGPQQNFLVLLGAKDWLREMCEGHPPAEFRPRASDSTGTSEAVLQPRKAADGLYGLRDAEGSHR